MRMFYKNRDFQWNKLCLLIELKEILWFQECAIKKILNKEGDKMLEWFLHF